MAMPNEPKTKHEYLTLQNKTEFKKRDQVFYI